MSTPNLILGESFVASFASCRIVSKIISVGFMNLIFLQKYSKFFEITKSNQKNAQIIDICNFRGLSEVFFSRRVGEKNAEKVAVW